MSLFNLHALLEAVQTGDMRRKALVSMSRTAEAAERYDDMCQLMKELVLSVVKDSSNPTLTQDERNLLSVAYKNVIGARRASWRTLNADATSDENKNNADLLVEYRKQIEAELSSICKDVLDLLTNKGLITSKTSELNEEEAEAKVFYLKMAADYYRYLAECVPEDASSASTRVKATDYYKQAFELAKLQLQATHPIRLGLALNYSVCLYEIMKNKTEACELAKNAFDDAIAKLDRLEEADYKDSTLIMQLLRDNLTLWTSSTDPEA
jgi:hypothetical protein